MKPRRTRKLLVVGITAVFALTACGGTDGDRTASSGGDIVTGGDLTVIESGDAGVFDPMRTDTFTIRDIVRNQALYDVLLYIDSDTGQMEYGTAQSLEPSDDFTTWTLTLRDGITFSDGTPYDADAVRFNIARAADPANNARAYGDAKDMVLTVTDPLTLTITLPEPNAQFPNTVANSFALIASPTALQSGSEAFARNPVGAGPFLFDEYVQGDHLRVVRNPNYWREEPPKLDSITFKTIVEPSQAAATLQAGYADVAVLTDLLTTRAEDLPGVTLQRSYPGGGQSVMLNNSNDALSDPRARHALQLAIDWDAFAEISTQGAGTVTRSLYRETSPFYDESKPLPSHDPEQAQELFDELAADGTPFDITLSVAQVPQTIAGGEFIESRLSQYDNVNVDLAVVPLADFSRIYFTGSFDATFGAALFHSPFPFLDQLLRSDSTFNNVKYANPKMDEILDAVRGAGDEAALAQAYSDLQDLYLEDMPFILTTTSGVGLAHTDKVGGLETRIHLGAAPLWQNVGFVA